MHWMYLVLAGAFEVCWAVGLKSSQGFTLFHEPAGAARLLCIGLIVAGIVGLKLLAHGS